MTSRRAFLAAGAALAAAPGLASASTLAPKSSPAESAIPRLNFDVAVFDAQIDRDAPHKHLFTTRKLEGGDVLSAVRNTLKAYRDIGVQANQVSSAAVLYHGASILIAMDDYVWDTYILPLPAAMKQVYPDIYSDVQSVLKRGGKGNPLLKPKPGDENASVQSLLADGLHFYVCNNALMGFAHIISNDKKKHAADVYADLCAHFVANSTVVPAGVWAIHAIQEKKYTLLQTS